jgi:hypothetical protein
VKYPEPYTKLLADSDQDGCDLIAAERELFEIDHCAAGAWLIERMPFPELREVVAWHHEPLTGGPFHMLQLVHIADRMADALGFGVLPSTPMPDFEAVRGDLPEPARVRFSCDPVELKTEIQSRLRDWE